LLAANADLLRENDAAALERPSLADIAQGPVDRLLTKLRSSNAPRAITGSSLRSVGRWPTYRVPPGPPSRLKPARLTHSSSRAAHATAWAKRVSSGRTGWSSPGRRCPKNRSRGPTPPNCFSVTAAGLIHEAGQQACLVVSCRPQGSASAWSVPRRFAIPAQTCRPNAESVLDVDSIASHARPVFLAAHGTQNTARRCPRPSCRSLARIGRFDWCRWSSSAPTTCGFSTTTS